MKENKQRQAPTLDSVIRNEINQHPDFKDDTKQRLFNLEAVLDEIRRVAEADSEEGRFLRNRFKEITGNVSHHYHVHNIENGISALLDDSSCPIAIVAINAYYPDLQNAHVYYLRKMKTPVFTDEVMLSTSNICYNPADIGQKLMEFILTPDATLPQDKRRTSGSIIIQDALFANFGYLFSPDTLAKKKNS